MLTILAVYYHAIILIFRPFLVANQAMRVTGGAGEIKEMWMRQACRYAIDAAQDSIEFFWNIDRVCGVGEALNCVQLYLIFVLIGFSLSSFLH